MANVLKLVYSALNFSDLQTGSGAAYIFNQDHNGLTDTNPYYYSVVFTADGKIVTHGKVYNTVEGESFVKIKGISDANDPIQLSLNNLGILSATLKDLYNPDLSVWTYGQHGQTTGSTTDNYAIKVPLLTIDTYGRVTAISLHNSVIHADYVKSVETNTDGQKYVLLGHPASASDGYVASTYANKNAYIEIDGTSPVLHVPSLTVSGGASKVSLGNTDGTLLLYIDSRISANDAMTFLGVLGTGTNQISNLPTNGYLKGYTYKVGTAGTYAGIACEVGDIIMAINDGPSTGTEVINLDWTVVLTNIDGAVTTSDTLTNNTLILGADGQAIKNLDNGSNGLYLAMGVSSPTWTSFLSLTIKDTKSTPTSLTYNPSAAKTLVFTGSATISGTSNDTITVTTTNNTYSLITAKAANAVSSPGSGTGAYLNLLTLANGSSSEVSSSIQLASSGDATITIAEDKITIGSTQYTATINGGLTLNGHAFSLTTGYSSSGRNYAVELDNGRPYVNVPWTDTNTWRPVNAYTLATNGANSTSAAEIRGGGIDTNALSFGPDFVAIDIDTTNNLPGSEIHLVWAEITSTGITYHV